MFTCIDRGLSDKVKRFELLPMYILGAHVQYTVSSEPGSLHGF